MEARRPWLDPGPLAAGTTFMAAALLSGCATPARLTELERALRARDSATAALGDWCATHAIAESPVITAHQIAGGLRTPPADIMRLLGEPPAEAIGYRHVELSCGRSVLSVAHNWYVKDRLTADMNAMLDTTPTPFGKVAAPLRFLRERLRSNRGAAPGCPSGTILSHRALLRMPDGRPLSLVVECYQRTLLTPG